MSGRVFSTAEFCAVAGLSVETAEEYLLGFVQCGVCERRLRSGWVATPKGLRISKGLAQVAVPERRRRAA